MTHASFLYRTECSVRRSSALRRDERLDEQLTIHAIGSRGTSLIGGRQRCCRYRSDLISIDDVSRCGDQWIFSFATRRTAKVVQIHCPEHRTAQVHVFDVRRLGWRILFSVGVER